MARGGWFPPKTSIVEKIHFILLHLLFHVITDSETLKGSRNIQGLVLIWTIFFAFLFLSANSTTFLEKKNQKIYLNNNCKKSWFFSMFY